MPWMFCWFDNVCSQLNSGSLNIDIEKSSEEGKALVCFAPGRQLQLQCLRVSSAAASHSKQQNHSTVHQSELCVYNTHMGKSIPLKPGCALPCLPARERPAHPYSPLSWPSARPPPCPPPVLLHNSAQCSQCIWRTLNRFAMQCWFSTALLGWVVGVRREQRGLPQ